MLAGDRRNPGDAVTIRCATAGDAEVALGRKVVGSVELTTVADDEAVLHDGPEVRHLEGLEPDTEYSVDGLTFRTLPRPPGRRLATFATVNDLHFGEVECGHYEGVDLGPILRAEPGEPPYPETMSRGAVEEIAALGPDAVLAKGDLTACGRPEEFAAFLAVYGDAFRGRLHYVKGNHDVASPSSPGGIDAPERVEVELPGVRLAMFDTSVRGQAGGAVGVETLDWLDELAARSDRPVLVFGHHHAWNPGKPSRPESYFGINPDDSVALVEVFTRRSSLCGYFAGHTHRNRVRQFAATGDLPWVEVSATKDFPGAWAEYRVFEGGVLQVFRRISTPPALAWSERTRAMFAGLYPGYSFGAIDDRCFPVWPRAI